LKLSPYTLAGIGLIVLTAAAFGGYHDCPGCFWLVLSGPLSLAAVALDWVPGVVVPAGKPVTLLIAAGVLTGLNGLLLAAHSLIPHPAAIAVTLLGSLLWLLTAFGVVAALG